MSLFFTSDAGFLIGFLLVLGALDHIMTET